MKHSKNKEKKKQNREKKNNNKHPSTPDPHTEQKKKKKKATLCFSDLKSEADFLLSLKDERFFSDSDSFVGLPALACC